ILSHYCKLCRDRHKKVQSSRTAHSGGGPRWPSANNEQLGSTASSARALNSSQSIALSARCLGVGQSQVSGMESWGYSAQIPAASSALKSRLSIASAR